MTAESTDATVRARSVGIDFEPYVATPPVPVVKRRPESVDRGARTTEPDWERLAPRGAYARIVRPAGEALLVLAALPLALALALPIALGNWLVFRDPRKILFVQERGGRRGRTFRIHKFRTMKEVHASSFDTWSDASDRLRVTRFGRFLRNSHLDELPQLLDVIRGEMSLVGPRPEMVEIERWARDEVDGFAERLAVRPGLTGLAQITQGYVGRCRAGYARKLELNRTYLRDFGPRQDLSILVRTVLWVLRRNGWRWQDQELANGGLDADPN
ncbi:MAG: sugar transferase [Planctomycetota bacterium]